MNVVGAEFIAGGSHVVELLRQFAPDVERTSGNFEAPVVGIIELGGEIVRAGCQHSGHSLCRA